MTEAQAPERRLNLLTGDWVLVSPDRIGRPWQGAIAPAPAEATPSHDPNCHLCPGATRAQGARNPDYAGVFIFDNDFPALVETGADAALSDDGVFVREAESGLCRVICYSPDHAAAMSAMTPGAIGAVVDAWAGQFADLAARPDVGAVTIFENRGEMMGASSAHPHGQVWATRGVQGELAREDARQGAWRAARPENLLASYLRRELGAGERVVLANQAFAAVVPFWAAWPFETLVLPRRQVDGLDRLDRAERAALADLLGRLTRAYDALFEAPFPYTLGFHQRPTDGRPSDHFTLHAHFYPPLLRSASIRKFMVGFEMLAMPQRDLTPEAAAARLRAVV
jgi:UDPglucose--hexose-1-phosphate uridylyltransferase